MDVQKAKCTDCEITVFVEKNENTTINLLCPVCCGYLINEEVITKQEGEINETDRGFYF